MSIMDLSGWFLSRELEDLDCSRLGRTTQATGAGPRRCYLVAGFKYNPPRAAVRARVPMAREHSRWFEKHPARGSSSRRVFCIPHAGGSGYPYRTWLWHLPEHLEL